MPQYTLSLSTSYPVYFLLYFALVWLKLHDDEVKSVHTERLVLWIFASSYDCVIFSEHLHHATLQILSQYFNFVAQFCYGNKHNRIRNLFQRLLLLFHSHTQIEKITLSSAYVLMIKPSDTSTSSHHCITGTYSIEKWKMISTVTCILQTVNLLILGVFKIGRVLKICLIFFQKYKVKWSEIYI